MVFSNLVCPIGTLSSPEGSGSWVIDSLAIVDWRYKECKASASDEDGGMRDSERKVYFVRRFLCAGKSDQRNITAIVSLRTFAHLSQLVILGSSYLKRVDGRRLLGSAIAAHHTESACR